MGDGEDVKGQDTSATGGYLAPHWFVAGEPPPPDIPQWGAPVHGVRIYAYDGSPDEYNDLRSGQIEDGTLVLGVGGDCGCGYVFIDMADLKTWLMEAVKSE